MVKEAWLRTAVEEGLAHEQNTRADKALEELTRQLLVSKVETHHEHSLCEAGGALIVHTLGALARPALSSLEEWGALGDGTSARGRSTPALFRVGKIIVVLNILVLVEVFSGLSVSRWDGLQLTKWP